MIAYFPAPYPDELFYSVLSRYYVQSGHMAFGHVANELFEVVPTKPNVDFISKPDSAKLKPILPLSGRYKSSRYSDQETSVTSVRDPSDVQRSGSDCRSPSVSFCA